MPTQQDLLKLASDIVGSQVKLARILNIAPSMINQIIKGLRPVPIEHCLGIERATKGLVTREMLRPSDHKKIWGSPKAYPKAVKKVAAEQF